MNKDLAESGSDILPGNTGMGSNSSNIFLYWLRLQSKFVEDLLSIVSTALEEGRRDMSRHGQTELGAGVFSAQLA